MAARSLSRNSSGQPHPVTSVGDSPRHSQWTMKDRLVGRERNDIQRSFFLHQKLSPVDSRRKHPDQGWRRTFPSVFCRQPPQKSTNPLAIETLANAGYLIAGLRSKSWDEFDSPNAPQMDFVITVCDNTARKICPVWPGHPVKFHWSIEDPAEVTGTREQRLAAFSEAFHRLRNRIVLFIAQPPRRH